MRAEETLDWLYGLLGNVVLLPIPRGEKGPKIAGWQTLTFQDRDKHYDELTKAVHRGGNIGVLLGPESDRLIALDLDDDSLVEPWLDRHPWLRKTLRSVGRRGCQFWMRLEPGAEFPNGQAVYPLKQDGKKIGELRLGGSGGAQSVIWGLHPEGMRYEIVVSKPPLVVSLADLDALAPGLLFGGEQERPDEIATANDSRALSAILWERVRKYLDKCEPAVSEQRGHDTAFGVLCRVIGGFDLTPEQAWEAALYYNQKCKPPWSEKELRHKVEDAFKATRSESRGHLLANAEHDTHLSQRSENEQTQRRESGDELTEQQKMLRAIEGAACSGEKLAALILHERAIIVEDWFREADYGLIFGFRGLGKSWFGLGIACAIANQGSFGPWVSKVAWPVLYVDGEMALKVVRERIVALCGSYPPNLAVLSHEALFEEDGVTLNLARHEHQRALSEFTVSKGIRVMILDNLSCLTAGLKENDADSWEPVKHWLLTLRRQRIAVVLVHHSGRSGKDLRGTTKREDDASWIVRLEEPPDDKDALGARFVSRFTKNRNASTEPPAYNWTIEPEHDGTVRVGAEKTSSDDVLIQWVKDGLSSASDIAIEMGVSKGMVSRRASALIKAGRLARQGRDYIIPSSDKTK